MKKRIFALILSVVLLIAFGSGCSDVFSDIASNVMDAAKAELENQIKQTLEEQKVDFVGLETAVGKLNDEGGNLQFYCAVLVRSDSDALPNAAASAAKKLFSETGVQIQTENKIVSEHLVHKELSFDHADFDDGNTYYLVWFYTGDMSIQLPDLNFNQTES